MPSYPYNINRTYANDSGNLAASGYFRGHVTQYLANMFPPWMHLRQNERSIGQQFLAPVGMQFGRMEEKMDEQFKSKYLFTAPIDEIDILYRIKLPSNVDLKDASASGVRCITAPSGLHPSGVNSIWLKESASVEEFYYHVLPTRVEVFSSGNFMSQIDGVSWNTKPSGILDKYQKRVDFYKDEHDITWGYDNGAFRKQDRYTMEDYETYELDSTYGIPLDMYFYKNMLWWVGKNDSDYYLNLTSTRTQVPKTRTLDHLASFNITDAFDLEPSGIIVDNEGVLMVCDTNKTRVYTIKPKYDYYILDRDNRYLYFREDYSNPGIFVSNT